MLSVASKNQSQTPDLLTDLFYAYYCARRNKRNSRSQMVFERNLSRNLIRLYDELKQGRYKPGRSMCFIIRDPVVREVFAASFRDRIVHHLLYNWLAPIFERTFIFDCYSCREGKGNLFGVKRLEHHIRSCSNNFAQPCYALKLDIENYFMCINRRILYDAVSAVLVSYSRKHSCGFDVPLALNLLSSVIFNDPVKSCYRKGQLSDWDSLQKGKSLFAAPSGCGLPIGNLTSQLFSNVYLTGLDNYVKRELKFKHYGRYVDDFYLVSTSKSELLESIPLIRNYLKTELGLTLHPRKIRITIIFKGVLFLGKVIRPLHTSVYSRVRKRSLNKFLNLLVEEHNPYRILASRQSMLFPLK